MLRLLKLPDEHELCWNEAVRPVRSPVDPCETPRAVKGSSKVCNIGIILGLYIRIKEKRWKLL